MNKGFVNKRMVMFLSYIWVFITTYTFSLGKFLIGYFFRFNVDDGTEKQKSDYFHVLQQKVNNQIDDSDCSELKFEPQVFSLQQGINNQIDDSESSEQSMGTEYVDDDGFSEKETPKFSFKFHFPVYEYNTRGETDEETEEEPKVSPLIMNTSKHEFLPVQNFSGFIEQPKKVMNFTVNQLYNDGSIEENDDDFHGGSSYDKTSLKPCSETEHSVDEKEQLVGLESTFDGDENLTEAEEEEIIGSDSDTDSDSDSVKFGDRFSYMIHVMDLSSEGFLSDEDFESEYETMVEESIEDIQNSSGAEIPETMDPGLDECLGTEFLTESDFGGKEQEPEAEESSGKMENSASVSGNSQESSLRNSTGPDTEDANEFEPEAEESSGKMENSVHDSGNSQESSLRNSTWPDTEDANEFEPEAEESSGKMENSVTDSGNSQESSLQNSTWPDTEDANEFESLWEHQELIEQLKMEMKKVRAAGLPTIFEDSEESPKVVENLKPWKIDEKFLHEDRIGELRKFYKIYTERMRKFDILNYQKMYAIGFLQLKDPLQTMLSRKSTAPTLTSVLSQSFGLSKRVNPEGESMGKFIKELQGELEVVYVGQLCLSWEYLHWQYLKARDLLVSDQYEVRPYNEVVGKFQQFQVLIQRFLEDEPFQGPRVQNYLKNRCVRRNLLQVPVVREDSKDKDGRRRKDAITCSMLLQIIEESMRILWEFLRADRNEGNMILKGLLGPRIKLHDPEDAELLVNVQTTLQKKEKKLKEIMRIGNCIARKFQKQHEEHSSGAEFHSQFDLKLVSRVLNMSIINTDQLVWCRMKLNNITLVDRKIHLESSFLPFPC